MPEFAVYEDTLSSWSTCLNLGLESQIAIRRGRLGQRMVITFCIFLHGRLPPWNCFNSKLVFISNGR